MSLLIVGEMPGVRDAPGAGALGLGSGYRSSGDHLASLAGTGRADSLGRVVNLITTRRESWPAAEAAISAGWLLASAPEDRWLLLGRRVAVAVGLARWTLLAWVRHEGRSMAVFPHPSGRNRWYNDPTHRAAAQRFLQTLHPPGI